jgi:outer membrane immunogenic protein
MQKAVVKGLASLFLAITASAPAFAADMYRGGAAGFKDGLADVPAVWTGFYLGGHIGGAWGSAPATDSGVFTFLTSPFTVSPFSSSGKVAGEGVLGGGQLGYSFQSGHWVLGAEADLGVLNLSGHKTFSNDDYSISGGFNGDFTGRLGYAQDRWLLYVKGGAAFLDATFRTDYGPGYVFDDKATHWGWTAGAGAEYLLSPNWSAKVEYQHFDFGNSSYQTNNYVVSGSFAHSEQVKYGLTADAVSAGINYHFGQGYGPLK